MVREPIDFTHVLEYAYLPKLRAFRYIVKSSTTIPLVLDFLRRHPKITLLTLGRDLVRDSTDWEVAQITPGHGLPAFLSFILQKCSLSVTIELSPRYPGPTKITILVMSDSFSVSSYLAAMAAYVPHARIVQVIRLESTGYVSSHEANNIAAQLRKMTWLSSLWLRADDEDEMAYYERYNDDKTVALWSAACNNLSSIQFRTWILQREMGTHSVLTWMQITENGTI
ncbi:hypothetical protein C8R45DRAFT_928006 [Mycena sanguinolenta]|nr:hypothetical protein C8R45DRAFT_928006 [Mycena sanguinolenta]